MGTEISILQQMIDREIDNIIASVAPQLSSFSGLAKQKVHGYIDPYIEAFLSSNGQVDTDTACNFAKDKALSEIEAFKAKLNKKEE